jgi:hypothetical protein
MKIGEQRVVSSVVLAPVKSWPKGMGISLVSFSNQELTEHVICPTSSSFPFGLLISFTPQSLETSLSSLEIIVFSSVGSWEKKHSS